MSKKSSKVFFAQRVKKPLAKGNEARNYLTNIRNFSMIQSMKKKETKYSVNCKGQI